jgi:Mrp family chromosome partitioning ATPase
MVGELGHSLEDVTRRVERLGPVSKGTVVLLTGCRRSAGCTVTAAALATAAAACRSVLLIDGDMSKPGLAEAAGLRPAFGWDEAVFRLCPLDQVIRHLDAGQQVPCLPLRQSVVRPEDLLTQAASQQWLARLRDEYRLIVIDGGAVGQSGALWAPYVDAALVVCDSGRTLADEWARAWDRLEEGGTHVLGIIETFV